jgi:hypothetical protein
MNSLLSPAPIAIGRLLRASTAACVVGCRVDQAGAPAFGSLVRIPLIDRIQIYGLIYDISIADDGLVRQLVTAHEVQPEVFDDNRINRSVPVEFSVLHAGYDQDGRISHLLPPRPPLSLDEIFPCADEEVARFTAAGRFGYFRHILRAATTLGVPAGELLAAHLQQAAAAQTACGDPAWRGRAVQELITLLRDDYPTLMAVLSALADVEE